MNSNSSFLNAIYVGKVRHQRHVDAKHFFEYKMFSLWLRISEVDDPQKKWAGVGRRNFGFLTVLAKDYMAHRAEKTLGQRIRAEILEKTNKNWDGEAYLLAQPRYLGFIMNPLSLFYCYDHDRRLAFVVGEITNTPWGERHCYVFDMQSQEAKRLQKFSFTKEFHVSPFLPMSMEYTWQIGTPGDRLAVGIWNKVGERLDFEAHMNLERQSLTLSNVLINFMKMPLMTWKIWFGIYLNAGILFILKRVTFYPHPRKSDIGKGAS